MDYIVAGLGNPGKEYENTRHNIGWLALDRLADDLGVTVNRLRFHGMCGQATVNGKKILLVKPQTYMNNSGDCLAEVCRYYNVSPEKLIVLCDDISLPVARLRIRPKGSAGGHNGLKSIIARLNSDAFLRIKIGVSDRSDARVDLADWVLGNFSSEERKKLDARLPDVSQAVQWIVSDRLSDAMSRFNGDPRA